MATDYKIEAKSITRRGSLLKADTLTADLTDALRVAQSLYVEWRQRESELSPTPAPAAATTQPRPQKS
jgi:predicted DNA-binding ribbon-helix-helix protein